MRGGDAPDGRRPEAILHWVSAAHAVPAEVRLYDYLFKSPYSGADGADRFEDLNRESETVLGGGFVEPSLADVPAGETAQFERLGDFCPDPDSAPGALVFDRTLTLRDTWAKLQRRDGQQSLTAFRPCCAAPAAALPSTYDGRGGSVSR